MFTRFPVQLAVAAVGLLILPPILLALGLTMTSATEVVVFGIACMALNILVGHTGLVSFGHGAWFGFAAYAAALIQLKLMPGSFFGPAILGVLVTSAVAIPLGYLILRRRGVYFSLLTLALAAMLYTVSFRWTDVTGGENGLGGITRPSILGFDLDSQTTYYWFVALIAFAVLFLLWRFHNSTIGSVLVAIRENEQRARFLGYPTNRYKLVAFTLSAALTGLAGILLLYKNRMTSADPVSVAFSGELLAMVVIGGMRSFVQRLARCSIFCSVNSSASTPRIGCSGSASYSLDSLSSHPRASSVSERSCWRHSARKSQKRPQCPRARLKPCLCRNFYGQKL